MCLRGDVGIKNLGRRRFDRNAEKPKGASRETNSTEWYIGESGALAQEDNPQSNCSVDNRANPATAVGKKRPLGENHHVRAFSWRLLLLPLAVQVPYLMIQRFPL